MTCILVKIIRQRQRIISNLSLRTEGDAVIRSRTASKKAGFVIVGVTVSLVTLILEEPRVLARCASIWPSICPGATVLRLIKRQTCAFTSDHLPVGPLQGELRRASRVDIGRATWGLAIPGTTLWCHWKRQVESVHQAHVVKVLSAVGCEGELYQGRRCDCTGTVTWNLVTPTVGGGADEFSGNVRGAMGSAPDSTGPWSRNLKRKRTSGW